jgi:glyoxylase-like metal-dependent hydrolase (beta-lactamase superfamily II)
MSDTRRLFVESLFDEATSTLVGETLFMPDYGTARCHLPGRDVALRYRSIRKALALPPQTRRYLCHDHVPGGCPVHPVTNEAEQRAFNVHEGVGEAEFVAMRRARDATLAMPQLILPSVQVNMRAGRFPPAPDNGIGQLKIPVDAL